MDRLTACNLAGWILRFVSFVIFRKTTLRREWEFDTEGRKDREGKERLGPAGFEPSLIEVWDLSRISSLGFRVSCACRVLKGCRSGVRPIGGAD